MIIGIDASRALRAQRTGTERYSLELINALLDLNSEHTIRLYAPTRPKFDLFRPNADIVVLPGQRLWTHTRLGPHTRRHPPDVLFVPAHVLPIRRPGQDRRHRPRPRLRAFPAGAPLAAAPIPALEHPPPHARRHARSSPIRRPPRTTLSASTTPTPTASMSSTWPLTPT